MSSAFALKAKNNQGGDYELAPAGTHPAVLIALIDLGTQRADYGDEVKWMRKVYVIWELTTEKKADGKNHVIGRDYTLTFGKKSLLRGLVEKWRGKEFGEDEEFDISKLMGKPCLLSVISKQTANGNSYSKVEGVSQLPKGMAKPVASYPTFACEVGQDVKAIPLWVPFLYGRKVSEVIAESREALGLGPVDEPKGKENGNGNGNGQNQQDDTWSPPDDNDISF